MRRFQLALFWLIPPALCLALYWRGLWVWFYQDDFAWLGLRLQVWDFRSLIDALFVPMAQGTIRPISERGFFLLFSHCFGLDAFPYRLVVFVTMFAALAVLACLVRRLTASSAAGVIAAGVWLANSCLVTPMSWTSAYNQVLSALVLLSAFYFFTRYVESGRRSEFLAQFVIFAAGFGVLEIIVVYPVLAAVYCLFYARRRMRAVLPAFAISALYAWFHFSVSPKPSTGPYVMHIDSGMASTWWQYWKLAFSGIGLHASAGIPAGVLRAAPWVVSGLLALHAGWSAARRDYLPLFGVAWFTIVIAPVLPLRDHFSEYYLTGPMLGLAIAAGHGAAAALRGGWKYRSLTALALAAYFVVHIPYIGPAMRWTYERSQKMRRLVSAMQQVKQLHPGKIVLLDGVTDELFWAGVYDNPFRLIGVEAYLMPGSESRIKMPGHLNSLQNYVLAEGVARKALLLNSAVAYRLMEDGRLQNITRRTRVLAAAAWRDEVPRHVELGKAHFEDQLGAGWYALEGGHRWMSGRARLKVGAPVRAGQRLVIHGYLPPEQLQAGPLFFTVYLNGGLLGKAPIPQTSPEFELSFPLPEDAVGRPWLDLEFESSRTYRPTGENRELGVAFGWVSVR